MVGGCSVMLKVFGFQNLWGPECLYGLLCRFPVGPSYYFYLVLLCRN